MNRKALLFVAFCMLLSLGFSFLPGPTAASAAPTPTPTAIPNQYKWGLEAIYLDTTAWEKDFSTVKETYLPQYKDYEGKLGNADKLVEFLKMDDQGSRMIEKLYVYAYMKSDGDQTNSQFTEMTSRAESLYTDMGSAYSFFKPELIALPQETLQSFMKDPRLTNYQLQYRLKTNEDRKVAYEGTTAGTRFTTNFPAVQARYVRLNILDSTRAPTIWEFQVFAK